MVNQVELHPYFAQPEALATMKYYNVQPEAWAPLGGGRHKPNRPAEAAPKRRRGKAAAEPVETMGLADVKMDGCGREETNGKRTTVNKSWSSFNRLN